MSVRSAVEPVFKSITVNADTSVAFDIFSNGIDRWWPAALRMGAGHAFRRLIVEPNRGGRWYAILDNGSEYPIARILEWEPPQRILFAWELNAQWRHNPELATEVEVRFIAQGKALTRVELVHRGFDCHGPADGQALRDRVAGGWPTIIAAYAEIIGRNSA